MRSASASICRNSCRNPLGRPRSVSIQRKRDVDVRSQRRCDRVPVLLAPHEGLPRVKVLRFMEVAVGNVGVVLEARDREQIVSVGRLPDVHELGHALSVIPEIARPDLDAPRRPMMWMTRNAQPALASNLFQDLVRRLISADPLFQLEPYDV